MTDKQAVRDALDRLPEQATLEDITEELQIMAAVRKGRADIAAGKSLSQAQAFQTFQSSAPAWTGKK
jgi:predicted transcriptional regulator